MAYYRSQTQKQTTEMLEETRMGEVEQYRSQQLQRVAAYPRTGGARVSGVGDLEGKSSLPTDL